MIHNQTTNKNIDPQGLPKFLREWYKTAFVGDTTKYMGDILEKIY